MRSKKMKNMTLFAFFLAVELVLLFTPLGFLRINPVISITFMHVPVIIASIKMGWKYGAALGLVFGLSSVWNATVAPGLTSFCFSPFITMGNVSGNFNSLIIALVPRVLIGVVSGIAYEKLIKYKHKETISVIISAFLGALTNTVLVLGLIYLFFGSSYAAATNVAYEALFGVLMGVVVTNGIAEALAGCAICTLVCKALKNL